LRSRFCTLLPWESENSVNEQEALKAEPMRSRPASVTAEKALPQSGKDLLVKIIKAYAVASNGGENQVNYKDVASAGGVRPRKVSANNRFLEESGILSSPKYGFYVPTEGAVRFARESAWDEKSAKAHLRRIVGNCWFGQVVVQNLALRSSLTRPELKKSLAIMCGAGSGDSAALNYLIDFVVYTELVEEDENGTLTRGNLDELEQPLPPSAPPALSPEASVAIAGRGQVTAESVQSRHVSLVVHLHVRDFEELTPDHASRLRQWMELVKGMGGALEIETGTRESQGTGT